MDNVTNTTETFRVEDLINLLLEKEKSIRYRRENDPPPMTVSQTEICLAIEISQFIHDCEINSKEATITIKVIDCNWLYLDGHFTSRGKPITYQNAAIALDNLIPKLVANPKVNLLEKNEKTVTLKFVF